MSYRDTLAQTMLRNLLSVIVISSFHVSGFVQVISPPHYSSVSSRLNSSVDSESCQPHLSLFSPSKINLFLRIIRRREDGFHDLSSLFQTIGFGDTLELCLKKNGSTSDAFDCTMPGIPTDPSNLVLRALGLMREKTGIERFFSVNLVKQVPAKSGLGGGSSNAATAMWGANELLGRPASQQQVGIS